MESKVYRQFFNYISLKWTGFYLYQLLEFYIRSDWHIKWQQPNIEGIFLELFIFGFFPFSELIILAWPFELALRQRGWRTVCMLVLAFSIEFLLSWYLTNQHIETWMIVKITGSIVLYLFLYRKRLMESILRPTL